MNKMIRCCLCLLLTAFLSLHGAARAQALHNPAAATEAFRKGRDAVRRGDYAAAYRLFQNSFELDPTPGTMLNIAECEDHLGLLVQAADHFKAASASMTSHDERLPVIAQRIAALEPRIPHILFPTVLGATSQSVVLDGFPLLSGSNETPFDKAIRVNPGQHSARWLVFFGSGAHVDVTVSFNVAESEIRSIAAPPEVQSAATAEQPGVQTPTPPMLTNAIGDGFNSVTAATGVTIHFVGNERDGWFVKRLATGEVLCDIPCVQVVPTNSTLQLGRTDNASDSVMVAIAGHRPGSELNVTPHGAASFGPGLVLMLSGVAVGVGAGVTDGVACSSDSCSGGVKTALLAGAGVGVGAFVTGLVRVVWEATHSTASADVQRRTSRLAPSANGLAVEF